MLLTEKHPTKSCRDGPNQKSNLSHKFANIKVVRRQINLDFRQADLMEVACPIFCPTTLAPWRGLCSGIGLGINLVHVGGAVEIVPVRAWVIPKAPAFSTQGWFDDGNTDNFFEPLQLARH